ncbi:MAG: recombination protein RecO [Sulfurimonas sp.]|nr:recombination protein RecO [Sulfurimonas sp.]MDQ7062261.1 recombination protein RecO [Sulfurimonas sp.]
MQGYIINLNRVKDEDLIVTIISKDSLQTLYRFYGARHGTINIGFKIDYEIEKSSKTTIDRLKDVIHIGFKWMHNYEKLGAWQNYLALFHKHLKDAEDIGTFYYDLIEEASQEWSHKNPKRIAIESYVKILAHEGRLHVEKICFLCAQKIKKDISLIRAYLPTHPYCSHTPSIDADALDELFTNQSSLFLNDKEVDRLWLVLLEGL